MQEIIPRFNSQFFVRFPELCRHNENEQPPTNFRNGNYLVKIKHIYIYINFSQHTNGSSRSIEIVMK